MTAFELKLLFLRNKTLLILIPLLTAIGVFFLLSRKPDTFTSSSSIFTGIATTYRIPGDNNEAYKQFTVEMAISDMLVIINSRETKKHVLLSLLAEHLMLDGYNSAILSNESYDRFKTLLPAALRKKLRGDNFDITLTNVTQYVNSNNTNELYRLLNSDDPVYSYHALSNVTAEQLTGSEVVQVEYSSPDPAISQHTLNYLDNTFINKQKILFATQSQGVIGYFDTSVQKAYTKLQAAEQKLYAFNRANNILDYDQQVSTSTVVKQGSQQRYNDLQQQYSGAVASLRTMEDDLKKRGVSNLQSQEIIRLRNQLSDISNQVTNLEAAGKTGAELNKLKQSAREISDKIKQGIDDYYSTTHSSQGVPIAELSDAYVKSMLTAEQLKGQLDAMKDQNAEISGDYKRLVPLGSESRRIKREIEVAQQDYLAQIEGLKQSKLSQENLELFSSQLKVLDLPNFPETPSNKGKLPILVLVAFAVSFVLLASLIVCMYLLDNSIKSPAHASELTGLPVISVLPSVDGKIRKSRRKLIERSAAGLARQVLLESHQQQKNEKPFVIGIFSMHSGEGKTYISHYINRQLNDWGIRTKTLSAEDQSVLEQTHAYSYGISGSLKGNSYMHRMDGNGSAEMDVVTIEFPPVLEENYSVSLLERVDLALLVVSAGRKWHKSDKLATEAIAKLVKNPVHLILTGAAKEYVKEYGGLHAGTSTRRLEQIPDEVPDVEEARVVYNS